MAGLLNDLRSLRSMMPTSPFPVYALRQALVLCLTLLLCLGAPPVAAQQTQNAGDTKADDATDDEARAQAERAVQRRKRLDELDAAILDKRREVQAFEQSTPGSGVAEQFATAEEVEAHTLELKQELSTLRSTFEELATAGVDKTLFDEQPAAEFDWQAELVDISKPIFDELRGLTEKPRQMERLRREIATGHAQREAASKAIDALRQLEPGSLQAPAAERIARLTQEWLERQSEIERAIEVATLRLDNLENDEQPFLERSKAQLLGFVQGRGLAIVLAVAAAMLAWFVMRLSLRYLEKKLRRGAGGHVSTRYRLIVYGHRLISILVMIVVVLAVFSIMGDFLLLAISIIAIVFALISLRELLPDYIAEAKLLIGVGAVREGERIVYEGLPYEVKTINVYSVLRNPHLEGVLRLPIRALVGQVSRPCKEEPWFPTQAGDYVLMPDASFGQVLRQTPEVVQLGVLGGMTQLHPSASFLSSGLKNISGGETYVVVVTFGIDYQHQTISQSDVAPKLHQSLTEGLSKETYGEDVARVFVDFKEAAASSLDYLIVITMNSSSASSYFGVGRKVQQICVDVCNREAWGIPFAQITVHQGDGFNGLRAAPAPGATITQTRAQ